ncbi:hypothetical protein EJB05_40059 [Eragrostis curvula]|uniref:Uncharacterized protein n=1 Tax=Eragrostis curvula TaxID=38414 RepID=A0A5J9U0J3_9POAL|nr:hypothetical protein EJB05_40059 [Eragrostis curvula]
MTLIRSLGRGLLAVQASFATARSVFMSQDSTHPSIDGANMRCNVKNLSSSASASSIEMPGVMVNRIMSVRCAQHCDDYCLVSEILPFVGFNNRSSLIMPLEILRCSSNWDILSQCRFAANRVMVHLVANAPEVHGLTRDSFSLYCNNRSS